MVDINEAWESFCEGNYDPCSSPVCSQSSLQPSLDIPSSTELYISTKTKLSYLNTDINLIDTFWKIPIIPYHIPVEGVIKKEIKFNSSTSEELNSMKALIPQDTYVDEHIITHIENPKGRIKFKDVRKVSIGISKRDVISTRGKKKGAFYNCFVLILRISHEGTFKEIHVKIFNTGKLKIPGIQNDIILNKTLNLLVKTLYSILPDRNNIPLCFVPDKTETVLINSNFNCGYHINRQKLYEILKNKYKLNCAYDPCSYPGIHSEFYYKVGCIEQNGQQPNAQELQQYKIKQLHFKVFRTGSILILGKCSESIVYEIYRFLCTLLKTEYTQVGGEHVKSIVKEENNKKIRKTRKKLIITA